jgi:hypothetical protein
MPWEDLARKNTVRNRDTDFGLIEISQDIYIVQCGENNYRETGACDQEQKYLDAWWQLSTSGTDQVHQKDEFSMYLISTRHL